MLLVSIAYMMIYWPLTLIPFWLSCVSAAYFRRFSHVLAGVLINLLWIVRVMMVGLAIDYWFLWVYHQNSNW